jgi:transposase InsO family protein
VYLLTVLIANAAYTYKFRPWLPLSASSAAHLDREKAVPRPERPNHVCSYDFIQDGTEKYTRRCLAIVVAHRLRSDDVLQCLTHLFVTHEPPEHVRSDNGPEFVAHSVRDWLGRLVRPPALTQYVVHSVIRPVI